MTNEIITSETNTRKTRKDKGIPRGERKNKSVVTATYRASKNTSITNTRGPKKIKKAVVGDNYIEATMNNMRIEIQPCFCEPKVRKERNDKGVTRGPRQVKKTAINTKQITISAKMADQFAALPVKGEEVISDLVKVTINNGSLVLAPASQANANFVFVPKKTIAGGKTSTLALRQKEIGRLIKLYGEEVVSNALADGKYGVVDCGWRRVALTGGEGVTIRSRSVVSKD